MNSKSITIAPFTWAKRRKRDFDRIIGCYDPDTWPGKIIQFHRPDPPQLLVLKFVDLDEPAPPPHGTRPELRLPTREDVATALDFDDPNEKLLIHCHAGISRSTALALAMLAGRMGTGAERAAVEELIKIRPEAVPNLEIVRLADLILGREGRLVEAVLERETPLSQERRRLNRKAYLTFYGCG